MGGHPLKTRGQIRLLAPLFRPAGRERGWGSEWGWSKKSPILKFRIPPLSPNPFPPPPGWKGEPTALFGRVFDGGACIFEGSTVGVFGAEPVCWAGHY